MRMTLQPDLAELAPGDEVEFHVAMANDGSDPVEVELELQGLDTDLWALSNPIPVIDAGTVGRTTIRVRMPDDATPGERRISVSIRDASGSVGASAAAALRVGSNDVVAIETDPASVSGRKGARLDTIVRNRGDDSLRLRVAGHSDGATVEIRPAEFDLPSGKGARLKAKITPTSRAWFRERRHGVVLDVRGGTIPATTSAIYVQKPTVPPVFLRALAVLLALAVWAGATLVLFQRMSSTPEEVATGEVTDVVDGDTTPPDVLLAGDVEEEDEGVAPPVVVAGTIDGPRELAGTRVLIERVSFGDEGTTDGSTGKVAALTPVALTSGTVLDKVETVTDEKGRFRVASGLIIGAFYRVTAARSGFDLRSQVVRTSEDTPEIELAMTLVPGQGAMTGRVVDGDGNPVGGANIVVTQGAVTYRTTTASTGDAIGTWTIDGLATPFTYLVTVASAGFASQQLTVEVDGGASVSGVDATVIRDRGTIRGRITYRDSGVGAVTVALDGEVSRTTTTLTTGDLTGSFDFPNLPYGTYLLTFTAPGWLESSREVTVAAGDVPIDVKDLLPSTAVIQGVVAQQVEAGGCDYPDPTQDAGAVDVGSCGGVGVTVTGENGTWSTTTATGDGSFRLSGIPAGEYTVEFARYGYLPEFYRVVVGAGDVLTLPDDATYDVEMAAYVGPRNRILEPLDSESVQMRLVPSIPLDAAEVTATVRDVTAIDTDFDQLIDTEGGRYFTDWTDGCRGDRVDVTVIGQPEVVCLLEPGGGFSLLGVAPGAAEIVVNAPGFGTSTSTIQVSPEGETQMGLIALTPLASLVLNVTGTGDVPVDGATVFVSPTDPDTPLFKGAAAVRDCTVTRADTNDIWQERSTIPDGHDSMKGVCADADSAGDISFARGLGTGSFEVILPVNGSDPTDPVALAGPVPLDHRQLTRAIDVQVGESARLDLRLRRYASIVGSFEIPDIDGEGFSDLTKLEGLDAFPAMGSGDDVNGDTTARGVEFCEVDPDTDECLPYDQVFVTPRFSFGKAAGLSDGQFRIDRIPPNEGQTLRDYRLRVFSDNGDVEKSTDRGDAISGLAFGEERSLNLVVSPLPRDVSFDVIWMNGAVETVIETAIARVTGVAGFRTIDVSPFREELVLTCPGSDCDTGVTSEDGFTYEVLPVGRTTSGVDGTFADLGADAKLTVNDVFRTGDLTVEVRAPGFVSRSVAIPVSEASADGGVDVVLVPSPRIVAGRIVISPDPTDELYQGLTATLEPVAGGTALLARVNAPVSGEGFGRYSFPSVTPGSYNLTVSGSGVFTAEAVVNVTPGATAFVADELVIGRQLTLDVAAYECPIDTTCTSAFERSAPGDHEYVGAATVTLSSRADASESWVTVSTGATCSDTNASGCIGLGLIRFTGLTSDLEYRVGVSRSGYRSPAAREIGNLSAGTTTADLELVSYGTLSGTVRGVIDEGDSVNSRLVGASVTLQHADGTTYPASGVYRTDSTGSFLVPATQQLKPGVYTATISADGYQTTTVSVGDADPSAGDPGIEDAVSYAVSSDVVLVAQPATISGSVTDSVTGNAVGGYVLVSVQGESCDAAFADVDPSNGLTQTDECRWILAGESSFS
ncbi:MAG: carboxypeptidase regulatory-like domain-containing protein, partial [Ilumatobacteraceae bacterium]